MNYWLVAYMVIYLAMCSAGIWDDVKSKYSFWWTGLDALSGAGLFAGMVFVLLNIQSEALKGAWLAVTAACILAVVGMMVVDIYDSRKERADDWKLSVAVLGSTTLLELPAFWLNLQYAIN